MKLKFAKLIPALCMLLISAVLVGTSTYAWFSMNTEVTATGMQVKAVAEDGIVIANESKSAWNQTATAAHADVTSLVPASAAAVTSPVFVHAASTDPNAAQAQQAVDKYAQLSGTGYAWSDTANSDGVFYHENGTNSAYDATGETVDTAYVLMNTFYIKSSGDTITKTLNIKEVTVTGASLKVENSLRVLVVVGNTAAIYAPAKNLADATTTMSYKWKNTTDVTAFESATLTPTSITSIPSTDGDAIAAKVYVYFEGEDENCKSVNISGIPTNNLSVSVKFSI